MPCGEEASSSPRGALEETRSWTSRVYKLPPTSQVNRIGHSVVTVRDLCLLRRVFRDRGLREGGNAPANPAGISLLRLIPRDELK